MTRSQDVAQMRTTITRRTRTVSLIIAAAATLAVLIGLMFYFSTPHAAVPDEIACTAYPEWSFDYWWCSQ